MNDRPTHWQNQGKQPDYRFSLANERTFLAWIRTALGILAGGVLLHQLATTLQPRWAITAMTLSLSVLAAVIGAAAFFRWRDVEIAMRHERALPRSMLMPMLSVAILLLAAVVAVLPLIA